MVGVHFSRQLAPPTALSRRARALTDGPHASFPRYAPSVCPYGVWFSGRGKNYPYIIIINFAGERNFVCAHTPIDVFGERTAAASVLIFPRNHLEVRTYTSAYDHRRMIDGARVFLACTCVVRVISLKNRRAVGDG